MRPLAAVVLGRGLRRTLLELVEMLRRQEADVQIVVVDDGEDDLTRRVLASLAAAERSDVEPVAAAPGAGRAALRNAGVAAARAETVFFLEPGCRLEPGYCRRGLEILAAEPEVDFVSCPGPRAADPRPGGLRAGGGLNLPDLLGRLGAVHPAALFRRRLWRQLRGFDEELPGLECDDFWLRAVAGGARGAVLDEALVRGRPARWRGDLRREQRIPALTALFAKHRRLFEGDPAAVLVPREGRLHELSGRRRRLLERRDRAAVEVERLNREIRELTEELRHHGRDRVEWGDLRRTTPISPEWGTDRGKPVDRRYIEEFLAAHAGDVRGAVLEVQEAEYTREYGGERVERSDVLDVNPENPRATVLADLRRADAIPAESYDCFILTRTVHVTDDMRSALRECYRILKPGGVLLLTFPCLSRVCLEYGEDGDFWRLTEAGARRLVYEVFPPEQVETETYGNVLTAAAFLYGLACEELSDEELEARDPFHPVLVGVRAVKPGNAPRLRRPSPPGVILAYRRVASCPWDVHGLCVAPEDFRAQMEHLRQHRNPLDLAELTARAAAGDLPPGAVAVTFDDGYADVLRVAAPILAELGVPATVFVATEGLDRAEPRELWWDSLERIFLQTEELPARLDIRLPGAAGESLPRATATAEERQAAHGALYRAILRCPPAQRDEALRRLGRWSGVGLRPAGDRRPMNGAEVVRLAGRDGWAIGAHGVHHLALSHQPFDTRQREIMESKTALERLLDRPVAAFAYPDHDVCDPAVDLVRAAGFRLAVTRAEGLVDGAADPLRLPRFPVSSRLRGSFAEWLERIFAGG